MGPADSRNRYDFLDVARGVAAMMVVLDHGAGAYIPGFAVWRDSFGSFGRIAVIAFLMITGFIIPQSLDRSGSVGRFWVRRVFRLFPAYWLSVAVAFAYTAVHPESKPLPALDDATTWLVNLTMLQGFFGLRDAWGVYWTLYIELIVYAACTILFVCRLTNHWKWILVLTLVAFATIGLGFPLIRGKFFGELGHRMLYITPLAGVVLQLYVSGRLSRFGAYGFLAAWAVIYGAVFLLNRPLRPDRLPWDVAFQLYLLNGAALFIVFGLAELRHFRMPRIAVWFGRISYSMYLLHAVWLYAMQVLAWPLAIRIPVYLLGVTVTSAAAYYWVERPGIALGRRVEEWIWGSAKPSAEATAPKEAPVSVAA